jgi:hypothetical protein
MAFTELRMEDTVVIRHTRPISARKRFTLEKILKSPIGEAAAVKAALATTVANIPHPSPQPRVHAAPPSS